MLLAQSHPSDDKMEPEIMEEDHEYTDETPVYTDLEHHSEELEKTAAETLLLLSQGHQSEEVREPAADALLFLSQGHQFEDSIQLELAEVGEQEHGMTNEMNLKIYEEVNRTVCNKNLELKVKISQMDKDMRLLREERNTFHMIALALKPKATERILNDLELLKLYTGLASVEQFHWLIQILKSDTTANLLTRETQLLIVLMKLKLNLLISDLAFRFEVSRTTASKVLDTWIPLLAGKLQVCISWPNKKYLKKTCPKSFKHSEYKDAVCIIDCTEVYVEKPSNLIAQSQLWSNYKSNLTFKFFVATTPSGGICFVSNTYGGRSSDKEITLHSGFLEKLAPGDLILADRGFFLEEYFIEKGAKLVVPSYTKGKKQLSKQEVLYSKRVSNVRIHIERIIKQIKCFHILKGKLTLNLLKHINNIIIVCAALSNLTKSVVP